MTLSVKVGGVTKNALAGSLQLDNIVEERTTMALEIDDPTATVAIEQGTIIELYDDATLLFAGPTEVSRLTPVRPGEYERRHKVECKDWHYLADRRILAGSYTNMTCGAIVQDDIGTILAAEGITVSAANIQDGETLERAEFNYVPVSQALDALAERSSFTWWISPAKVLYFRAFATANPSPWSLTWDDIDEVRPTLITGNAMYRNRQYLRGGKDTTSEQVESFVADGEQRTFVCSFPMAAVPTTIKVDTVSKTKGIRGVETGKDFYWNIDSNEISTDLDVAPLTAGQVVEVTYYGSYQMIALGGDQNEVLRLQAVEGVGTGIVEVVEDDPSIRSRVQAFELISGKLRRYAQVGGILTFTTHRSGLEIGQMLNVTLTELGLTAVDFGITQVTVTDWDGVSLRYQVQAVVGPNLGSPTRYFDYLAGRGASFVIRENLSEAEILILLAQTAEDYDWAEAVTETPYSCPLPSSTLYPSATLYPC